MTTSELRLGNLIKFSGSIGAIESIQNMNVEARHGEHLRFHHIAHIEPIELTEEWLRKLGFDDKEYKGGYIGIDVAHTDFTLVKPNKESEDVTLEYYAFHCKYGGWPRYIEFKWVHEIQNFFYTLHGEDLKLTEKITA